MHTDGPERAPYPGTPRWVKLFAVVTAAVVLVIVLVLGVGTALGLHTPGGPGHQPASPAHTR